MKSFARIFSVIVVFTFLFSQSAVFAFTTDINKLLKNDIILFVGSPKAYFNNYETQIDTDNIKVCPFVRSGRTLIPVRFISEKLGAVIDFQKAESKVIIKYKDKTISFVIGKNEIAINGRTTKIDTTAMVENGRTYIPLRAMVEALDKSVFWDVSGLIVIGDKENVPVSLEQSQLKELNDKFKPVGNIPGYIVNDNTFARQGDWVYYSDVSGLFKSRIKGTWTDSGTGTVKITDMIFSDINIVGEWIYGVSRIKGKTESYGIYRIKTDGTQKQQLNYDSASFVNVTGEWIYYINTGDLYTPYKIKTDGTCRQKMSNMKMNALVVADDFMYFQNANDNDCIYKIKTDLSQLTKISSKGGGLTRLNVVGDWVYLYESYYESSNNTTGKLINESATGLYKIKTDGTQEQKLDAALVSCIVVIDDWIYYSTYKDALYRMKVDGSGKQMLYKGDIRNFTVIDDWILLIANTGTDKEVNYTDVIVKTDGSYSEVVP